MASNAQKQHYSKTSDAYLQSRSNDFSWVEGQALPATVTAVEGSIVTVSLTLNASPFVIPGLVVPVIGTEYLRAPIQVGCKGMVISADAYLDAQTGLGSGTPDFTQPANLTALAFVPLGNKGWTSVDGNKLVLYGVNGLILQDAASPTCKITLTNEGFVATLGALTLTFSSAGLALSGGGKITDNGVSVETHVHTNTQPGTGESGAPLNPS